MCFAGFFSAQLRVLCVSAFRANSSFRLHSYGSAEADFANAVVEVFRAADDLDFHAHEVERQVAAINLREAHGVFLRGDDEFGLALLAAVDGVEDLLLAEPVMISEALGIDQFRPHACQALLEALRLRDSAERSDFLSLDELQTLALAVNTSSKYSG